MNQLPNIKSISILPKVNYDSVIPGKYYAIKYNVGIRMDYIVKCISIGNFLIIYFRKRKIYGNTNYNKWEKVNEKLYIRLSPSDNNSSVHELSLNSQITSINQPRAQNSINVNNNKVNLSKFKEMLTCKICFEKTINQVLNCGHNFCKSCVDKLPMQFDCPICKAKINKATDVRNIYF